MLRAPMKSTGNQWMRQVLVQSLTRKFEDAATLHGPNTVVEATGQDLPVYDQPVSGLLSHEPEDAAKKISQLASDHFKSKVSKT